MAKVPRVRPSPDKLRELAEHVVYEVKMLVGTATKLLGTRTTDWVDVRAQAESFLIHTRALYQFFYWTPPKRIKVSATRAPSIFAVDYVPDWQPGTSQTLAEVSNDVGRRVAHLTVERVVGQEYPALDAARALLEVICKFRDANPPDFVGDLGDLSPHWAGRPGLVYSGPSVVTTNAPPQVTVASVGDVRGTPAAATADVISPVVSGGTGQER